MKKLYWIYIFIIISMIILRFVFISIPGLHGDEAWFGLNINKIIKENYFPFNGMTPYTGALTSYLGVPFFLILGSSIFSLRLLYIIIWILTIFLSYLLMKKLYNKKVGILSALLFSTMIWSFIYSNIAWEICLFPFFIISSLYFLNKEKIKYKILGAVILGIGVYNHILFLIFPISFFLYKFVFKIKDFFKKENLVLVIPTIFFIIIRIISILNFENKNYIHSKQSEISSNLFNFHFIFNLLDGSIIFERFVGMNLIKIIPITSFIFIFSFIFLLIEKHEFNYNFKKNNHMFIFLFCSTLFLTLIFIINFSLRYFLIPLTFANLLIAIFLGTTRKIKKIIIPIIFILIFSNIFYINFNYLYNFEKTEGTINFFPIRNTLLRSWHTIDSYPAYSCLNNLINKTENIMTDTYFIQKPLEFYDYKNKKLKFVRKIFPDKFYFIELKNENNVERYNNTGKYFIYKKCDNLKNYNVHFIKI